MFSSMLHFDVAAQVPRSRRLRTRCTKSFVFDLSAVGHSASLIRALEMKAPAGRPSVHRHALLAGQLGAWFLRSIQVLPP